MRHIFILLLIVSSCSVPEHLSKEELQAFVQEEENGLMVHRRVGQVDMKVSYRPNDLLVWQEVEGEDDTTRIARAISQYNDYAYFILQLSTGEKDALYGLSPNQMIFNDRLQTLSYRMNQFVFLTTSNADTVPLADFYYTRLFGLSKSNDVLLVFNRSTFSVAEWVSINTTEFGFKTGRQSFRFNRETLDRVPRLSELASKLNN